MNLYFTARSDEASCQYCRRSTALLSISNRTSSELMSAGSSAISFHIVAGAAVKNGKPLQTRHFVLSYRANQYTNGDFHYQPHGNSEEGEGEPSIFALLGVDQKPRNSPNLVCTCLYCIKRKCKLYFRTNRLSISCPTSLDPQRHTLIIAETTQACTGQSQNH